MFWRFRDTGNGKNEYGMTYEEAFANFIESLINILAGKADNNFENDGDRKFYYYNALGNLRIYYDEDKKYLSCFGGQAHVWKNKILESLAAFHNRTPGEYEADLSKKFSDLDHKWKWMPFNKK